VYVVDEPLPKWGEQVQVKKTMEIFVTWIGSYDVMIIGIWRH